MIELQTTILIVCVQGRRAIKQLVKCALFVHEFCFKHYESESITSDHLVKTSPHNGATQHQTSNLRVGSSNLSERARSPSYFSILAASAFGCAQNEWGVATDW